jgi:hypothetical protein
MNTDITLATELELSDIELETVVGGRGALIGSISIINSWGPFNLGSGSGSNYSQSYNGTTNTSGVFFKGVNGGSGQVTNAGGNSVTNSW